MALLEVDRYTASTRLRALRWLYAIDQQDIDAFMRSYILFDGDWDNQNGKQEAHIVDYYRVLNHLCALGSVEKMYFPPLLDEKAGVRGNQELFERRMMEQIGARPGTRVLDIGCGRGRVACHVARHAGAHVTGLNIDPTQIQNARAYAKSQRLAEHTSFLRGSFNDPLPFADESFDAGYQIQAFTYAKDKTVVFKEIFRVLRPGARFLYLDWVRLPGFDPNDPEHVSIMKRTCAVIGAVDTPSPQEVEAAMEQAGFEVLSSGDPSVGGHQSALVQTERRYFGLLRRGVKLGVKARLVPRHLLPLLERLGDGGEAFVQADQRGLATTSYQIVCEKPA